MQWFNTELYRLLKKLLKDLFISLCAIFYRYLQTDNSAFAGKSATFLPSLTVPIGVTALGFFSQGVVVAGVPAVELSQKGKA